VMLFVVPALAVVEQPRFGESVRIVRQLLRERKMVMVRIFGVGLALAVISVIPAYLVFRGTHELFWWLYGWLCGEPFTEFVRFVVDVLSAFVWAPIFTVGLAFLNSLSLAAHDDVLGTLYRGEEEDEEEDDEEEDELQVEGLEPGAAEADRAAGEKPGSGAPSPSAGT